MTEHPHKGSAEGAAYDIVALGECLVDFLPSPMPCDGALSYCGYPGGAPMNVLVCNSQLGLRTALIGKVGDDVFGQRIMEYLREKSVDTTSMILTQEHPTTLTFVSLDKTGNRSFRFYRNQTADCMLDEREIPYHVIEQARIFHFGTVSMTVQPTRQATLAAARHAKQKGLLVSFDPNLREMLWPHPDEAQETLHSCLELADLVKLSQEELEFLCGSDGSLGNHAENLFHQLGLKLLVVTLGGDGCLCVSPCGTFSSWAYDVKTVDTTGAGDAFWGAILYWITRLQKEGRSLDPASIQDMLNFANAAGSMTTAQMGAIPAGPEQIEYCLHHVEHLSKNKRFDGK